MNVAEVGPGTGMLAGNLEPGAYDLVHAGAVARYLPDRDRELTLMAGALRPGGWLVVEGADLGPATIAAIAPYLPAARYDYRYERMAHAAHARFAGAGGQCGAQLYHALLDLGLRRVDAEVHAPAGSACVTRTVGQLRARSRDPGPVGEIGIHELIQTAADPELRAAPMVTVTAWGQRADG